MHDHQNIGETIASYLIALVGLIVGWLEPSRLLIILSIVLCAIKIVHSLIILRREFHPKK